MPEHFPVPPPVTDTYRPVAWMAIIGASLAGIFVVLSLISAGVALALGAPFFFPMWVLAIAAGGAIFSYLGMSQVRSAEGALAGLELGRWGLWLSLLSGTGYVAYYSVTGLALKQQAHGFLTVRKDADSGFFAHVLEGSSNPTEFNRAFLLTLPATSRGGASPDNLEDMLREHNQPISADGGPGLLYQFRLAPLVAVLGNTSGSAAVRADQVSIEPEGLKGWIYEKNHYVLERNYRITTLEGVFDFLITTESTEPASEGEVRKWFVALPKSNLSAPYTPSPKGSTIQVMRQQAKLFSSQWIEQLNSGKALENYKDIQGTDWSHLGLGADTLKQINQSIDALFTSTAPGRLSMEVLPRDLFTPWEISQGKLRMTQIFRLRLPATSGTPAYQLFGNLVAETLGDFNLDSPPAAAPQWKIVRLEIQNAAPVVAEQQ